jgi:hypothetical protein
MGLVKKRLMNTVWVTPTGFGSAYTFRYTGMSIAALAGAIRDTCIIIGTIKTNARNTANKDFVFCIFLLL